MSSYASTHTEIAITGRGVISSIGEGPDAFVDALLERRSGVVDGMAPCAEFAPESAMNAKVARRSDRYTQLAFAAAVQAAAEAGLPGDVDLERLAILVGTGVGGLKTLEDECRKFVDGGERAVSPHFVPMMMPNAAAGLVAMELGAKGPGWSVNSACATGNHAIGEGKRLIERGEADVVVAGGSEAALTTLCLAAFKRMGAMSRRGVSCPFDQRRDGFIMGEGAGVLVLEREDHARARGATIYGRVVGYGASNDAHHITQPDETGAGAKLAMRMALADADAQPRDVGYVNAHGTSTPLNDRTEAAAVREVFDGHVPATSSTKSAIGHLLGAAGAVEAVATLGALGRRRLPPTLNLEQPDPECELPHITAAQDAPDTELALSNAFGFGGQNACLAVARA